MDSPYRYDPALARLLILDELFDLSLYKVLRDISADPEARDTLSQLVVIETRHLAFWQKFFDMKLERLNLARRLKLWSFTWLCRLFGSTAIHLVLEAIEIYGVKKYLPSGMRIKISLWAKHSRGFYGTSSNMKMPLLPNSLRARSILKRSAISSWDSMTAWWRFLAR